MKLQKVQTPEVKQIVTLAQKKHWGIRVLGEGEIPALPVFRNGWWYEPLTAESTIPSVAVQRAQEILRLGIRPQGFLIAHQASTLLCPPAPSEQPAEPKPQMAPKLAPTIGVGVLGLLTFILSALGLMAQAMLLDPALIVVLEDGTMVEVARWYNE